MLTCGTDSFCLSETLLTHLVITRKTLGGTAPSPRRQPSCCSPETLLTGDNDTAVLGNFLLDLSKEAQVGLHVGASQPPSTHAKGRCLLQEGIGAELILHHKDGDVDSSIDSSLYRK